MAKITNKHIYECGKCKSGEIFLTHKIDGANNEVVISKCSNNKCRYQYYYKGLFSAGLKEITALNGNEKEVGEKLKSIRLQEVINVNKPTWELFCPVLRFGNSKKGEYKFPIVFKDKTQAGNLYDELSLLIGKTIEEVKTESSQLFEKYKKFHYQKKFHYRQSANLIT